MWSMRKHRGPKVHAMFSLRNDDDPKEHVTTHQVSLPSQRPKSGKTQQRLPQRLWENHTTKTVVFSEREGGTEQTEAHQGCSLRPPCPAPLVLHQGAFFKIRNKPRVPRRPAPASPSHSAPVSSLCFRCVPQVRNLTHRPRKSLSSFSGKPALRPTPAAHAPTHRVPAPLTTQAARRALPGSGATGRETHCRW